MSSNSADFSAERPAAKSRLGRTTTACPQSPGGRMERRQFLQSTVLGAAATMLGVAPPAAAATQLSLLQENLMSNEARPYEPLTSENAALVLIDHQVGLMTGVRDYS